MRPRTGIAGEFAVESVVVGVRREDGGTDEHRAWPASPAEMFRPTARGGRSGGTTARVAVASLRHRM